MTNAYDDIIHLPRHVSAKHPQMAVSDRAAQFAPFAALTGHDAAIKEKARLTDERRELDEYMMDALRDRLQKIAERLEERPEITVTYFRPDEKKTGGAYIAAAGVVKRVDEYKRVIVMGDGKMIPIDEIISIEGEIFDTRLQPLGSRSS
ncbi:MAG: hypothetical protein AAGU12_11055 [Clostridiales bacterium]